VQLAPFPQGVAAPGLLDLYYLCSELGEQARAERARDQRAQLDYLDALQRKGLRFAHVKDPLAAENAESAGNSTGCGRSAPLSGLGDRKTRVRSARCPFPELVPSLYGDSLALPKALMFLTTR
jgi:hypothetical protein